MPTTFYNVTLNGVNSFNDIYGNTFNWGGNKHIGYLNNWEGNGNDLDATVNLSGSGWTVEYFHMGASAAGIIRVNDNTGSDGAYMRNMTLGESSVVNMDKTFVSTIEGFGGVSSHKVSLGSAGAGTVNLNGETNVVETGSGFVRSINTGGADTVIINGGAISVVTGDQRDIVRLKGGFTDNVAVSDGNDLFVAQGGGVGKVWMGNGADIARLFSEFTQNLSMGDGRDTVIANGGDAKVVNLGRGLDKLVVKGDSRITLAEGERGTKTVEVSGNGRISTFESYETTNIIDVQDQGRIQKFNTGDSVNKMTLNGGFTESIHSWRSENDIFVGKDTGVGSITASSDDGAQAQKYVIGGWVGSIQVWGGQKANIVVNGSVATISTYDGNDRIVVRGEADMISTHDGNDRIALIGGDVEYVNGGSGRDTILGSGAEDDFVGGSGNDILRGGGNVDFLRGGSGNDYLDGDGGNDQLFGGKGADRLEGAQGRDVMAGGAGRDQFIFKKNTGIDWITDFEDGLDLIKFMDQSGKVGSLNMKNVRGDLHIIHDHGKIILEDMAGTNLTADDFVFV